MGALKVDAHDAVVVVEEDVGGASQIEVESKIRINIGPQMAASFYSEIV
jgi:hypothetical protein